MTAVDLCFNDHRNGAFLGKCRAASFVTLREELTLSGPTVPVKRRGDDELVLAGERVTHRGVSPWVGNWCWDRYDVSQVDAERLMRRLLLEGWTIESCNPGERLCDLAEGGAWSRDAQGLRALTLCQPFASAIAQGPKRIENRPGRLWGAGRLPVWVGLHAGLTVWDVNLKELWPEQPPHADLVRGALLGVMRVVACVDQQDTRVAADPWATGPWCAVIDEVRLFDTPIPQRGYQGLWRPELEAAEAMARLVQAAPQRAA